MALSLIESLSGSLLVRARAKKQYALGLSPRWTAGRSQRRIERPGGGDAPGVIGNNNQRRRPPRLQRGSKREDLEFIYSGFPRHECRCLRNYSPDPAEFGAPVLTRAGSPAAHAVATGRVVPSAPCTPCPAEPRPQRYPCSLPVPCQGWPETLRPALRDACKAGTHVVPGRQHRVLWFAHQEVVYDKYESTRRTRCRSTRSPSRRGDLHACPSGSGSATLPAAAAAGHVVCQLGIREGFGCTKVREMPL